MKALDIIKLAWQNLRRRKARTILTAVGVMIGCTSIVVMVSIGAALDETTEQSLNNMGDLTMINVYSWEGADVEIDDALIESIKAIDGVQVASPKLRVNDLAVSARAKNGRYSSNYSNLIGMEPEMLEAMGIEMSEGSLDLESPSRSKIPVAAGDLAIYNFIDTMRPDGSNQINPYTDEYFEAMQAGEDPADVMPEGWFDLAKENITLSLRSFENQDQKYDAEAEVKGIAKTNQSLYELQNGFVMDLSTMKQMVADARKNLGLPSKKDVYDELLIKAASIEQVDDVEKELKALGLSNISSMVSIRESMKQSARMTQLILGGIGAVSLIVAAVGITNTMYMSISERTKEIGIMKALGCKTSDIRWIFLCEAGIIGFLGGALGAALSGLLSLGINYIGYQMQGLDKSFWEVLFTPGNRLSVIPLWLMLFGVGFSIAVGLFAGYFPAKRAVKIPALEAIKHE